MKWICSRMLLWAVAAVSMLAVGGKTFAADPAPVFVLSVSSIDKTIGDVVYLTKAAGQEDAGKTVALFGNAFTNGLDKKTPIGMYVSPVDGGAEFQAVVFVPIKDLKTVLGTFKEQIGEPKDAGDGVLEIAAGQQSAFLKEQGAWAFVAQKKEHLENLPENPAALLGDLPKNYTVAVRVMMNNLPNELKELAITSMSEAFERGLEQRLDNDSDEDKELAEKLARIQIENLKKMIEEVETLTMGINADAQTKKTYLDFAITAKDGTDLAAQMAKGANLKTGFAGFQLPGAAATVSFTGVVSKDDVENLQSMIKSGHQRIEDEIDDDDGMSEEKKDAAKEIMDSLFEVLDQTVAEGKLDGGAVLMLEPKSIHFALGGLIADGAAVEKAFAKLVEVAQDDPDFPKVKLNSGTHAGVNYHTLTGDIKTDELEVREIFGEKFKVVIGTGKKSLFVAFGKDAEGLLSKIIDKSAADGAKTALPTEIHVSLLPILKFAASVDNNDQLPALIAVLEKGASDKISLLAKPIPRGQLGRFEVSDGILQVIGEAIKRGAGRGL